MLILRLVDNSKSLRRLLSVCKHILQFEKCFVFLLGIEVNSFSERNEFINLK